MTRLSAERDAAWERAARLTVLAREMEAEAHRLRDRAARRGPQTYEALGTRAQHLLALAEEEALEVRAAAREQAGAVVELAEQAACEIREAATAHATALRAEVEEWVGRRLLADRTAADALRDTARGEARAVRKEALALLREARQRVAALRTEQEREQADQWAAAEREITARADARDAEEARRVAAARARLRDAEQALAQAQVAADHVQERARECAAQLLGEARERSEWIGRETERLLHEHRARQEAVLAHLERVLGGLRTLPVGDAAPRESL